MRLDERFESYMRTTVLHLAKHNKFSLIGYSCCMIQTASGAEVITDNCFFLSKLKNITRDLGHFRKQYYLQL